MYRLAQGLLAPGGDREVAALLGRLAGAAPPDRPWLDIGCGPRSLVPVPAAGVVALDRAPAYVAAVTRQGHAACVGDATRLPFPDGRFGAAWTIGLLHHLDDRAVRATLAEMARVVGAGGQVHVIDAVLPWQAWRRPLAYAVRRLDRGRFMRREAALQALLPAGLAWRLERRTYTASGLELLACSARIA